jgi:alpha-beta hydrolase superfamily lysophospholipase
MRKEIFTTVLIAISFACFSSDLAKKKAYKQGQLVSARLIKNFTDAEMASEINTSFANLGQDISDLTSNAVAVNSYAIRYRTLNYNGKKIIVSGMVAFPASGDGVYPVVQYQHCTQFNKKNVPSNPSRNWESLPTMALFAAQGYIVSMPDYIGQGRSKKRHPYMHAESIAVSCSDMLKAVAELCTKLNINTDSRLFICGFSEGGHATMALQKHIEETPDAQPFQLTASAPIDGPYKVYDCWNKITLTLTAPELCAPIAARMYLSFRKIYKFKEKLRDVFFSPRNRQLRQIDRGKYDPDPDPDDPDDPDDFFNKSVQDIMHKSFLEEVTSREHPMYSAMEQNNTYDFLPLTPTRLYHAESDELVPYSMSEMVCSHMKSLGAEDVEVVNSEASSHLKSFFPSMLMAKRWFDTF